MKRYTDQVLSAATGLPMLGAKITVNITGTNMPARIYATDDEQSPQAANPFTASRSFSFYAPDGRYDIIVTANGRTSSLIDIELVDLLEIVRRLEAVENGEPGFAGSLRADLLAAGGAGRIGFLQAGADAVLRTLQEKGREIRSAADWGYGLPGNTSAQNAAALKAAIAYQQTVAGALLIPFAPGTFIDPVAVTLTGAPLILVGDGPMASVLRKPNLSPEPVLTISSSGNLYPYTYIAGLRFDNGLRGQRAGVGLKLVDVPRFVIDRCIFEGCSTGLRAEGALIGGILASSAINNDVGYDFTKSPTNVFANLIKIDRGEVLGNRLGLRFDWGCQLNVEFVDFEHNGVAGDLTTGAISFGSNLHAEAGYSHVRVSGWFEGNKGTTIRGVNPGNANCNISIEHCLFVGNEPDNEVVLTSWGAITLRSVLAPQGIWTTKARDIDSDIASVVKALNDTSENGPANLRTSTNRYAHSMNLARIRAQSFPFAAQDLLMSTDDNILGGPNKDVGFAKYGDGEFWLGHVTRKMVRLNQTGIGFFGGAPVAKPQAVPVTAEGVHSALVSLGLIAG